MSLRAAFAEADITPPVGIMKVGWLKELVAEEILDPLFARVAVFECEGEQIAFVQLDTLSVRWSQVDDIRRRVSAQHGFPGEHIMVSATHNHAWPALTSAGDVRRDEAYAERLTQRIVEVFGRALAQMQPAQLGFGSCCEFGVGYNRRVILRNGVVRTHGNFSDPLALCYEGPVDPEVCVIAARTRSAARTAEGEPLGALVNFACHPTHHGAAGALSAGYPGVLVATMKESGWPVTLFLNGAAGNIHTANPAAGGADPGMEQAGQRLAEDALRVIGGMEFREGVKLASRKATAQLPYREVTEAERTGPAPGAARGVDPAIYERAIPRLEERIRQRGTQPAEVQVHFLDEYALASAPAEYFVQFGLRIKEEAWPRHALIVGFANGMVGYLPHREAFLRGGYEATFTDSSRMAPEAGDLIADCAIALIRAG